MVLPYWNLGGPELDALEIGLAKELAKSTHLAKQPKLEVVPYEEVQRAIEHSLTAAERDALVAVEKRGDPNAAIPFLTTLVKGANAQLAIFGTVSKVGGGDGSSVQTEIDSWLLALGKNGQLEDPVRHQFRGAASGSLIMLGRQAAEDEWWESSEEMKWFASLGTLHPDALQKKYENLKHLANKDRIKIAQEIFPEEFLHAQTCKISPEQMRDAALATDQLVQALEPKNPRSHNYRGLVEYCGKNRPQALRYFEKATSLDASFPDPWYNAGTIHWEDYEGSHSADDLERALQAFSKAVDDEPGFAEARAKRGLAWLAKGDAKKAEADLTGALREDRKNPDVLLGRCQLALAAQRPDQAQDFCKEALRADPALASARKILGDIARDQKRPALAISSYREAVATNPEYVDARLELIKVLFDDKRYADARKECDALIAVAPNHSVPRYFTGKICELQRDFACAEQSYQQAFELDSGWTTLRDDIARVRKLNGGRSALPVSRPTPKPAATGADSAADRPLPPGGSARPPASTAAPQRPGVGAPASPGDAAVDYQDFLRKYEATKPK